MSSVVTTQSASSPEDGNGALFDAVVIQAFHAEDDSELTVKKHDMVIVKKVFEDGWSLCESLTTRCEGLIPTKYYEKTELASIEPKRMKIPVRKGSVRQLQNRLNLDMILGNLPATSATVITTTTTTSSNPQRKSDNIPSPLPSPVNSKPEQIDPEQRFVAKNSQIRKMQEKRQHIRAEILSTEETYINCLNILRNRFALPVKKLKLLSDDVYRTIFPNAINVIIDLNTSFYEYLKRIIVGSSVSMALSPEQVQKIMAFEEANLHSPTSPTSAEPELQQSNGFHDHTISANTSNRQSFEINPLESQSTQLAKLILHVASTFKLYTDYISRYPTMLNTLMQEKAKNKRFAFYLQEQRRILRENKTMSCTTLEDLLITPIQRLPRYRLLFEDLMRQTEPLHESYKLISEAVETIDGIAKFCNDKEAEFLNMYTLNHILKKFKLKDFLHSSRKLVMKFEDQTEVRYMRSNGSTIADCDLYILSDVLILSKRKLSLGKSKPTIQYLRKDMDTQNKGTVTDVKATMDKITVDQQPHYTLTIQTMYSDSKNNTTQKTILISRSEEAISKIFSVVNPAVPTTINTTNTSNSTTTSTSSPPTSPTTTPSTPTS
jgi:hypothetical protein